MNIYHGVLLLIELADLIKLLVCLSEPKDINTVPFVFCVIKSGLSFSIFCEGTMISELHCSGSVTSSHLMVLGIFNLEFCVENCKSKVCPLGRVSKP